MSLRLKSKKHIRLIAILVASLISSVALFWSVLDTVWTTLDFQILDLYYRQAVRRGYGPPRSSQVVYVTITDDSYNYFKKNILDRADMARVNNALAYFGVDAVAYDIIFARPSNPRSDRQFTDSLHNLGSVYLPIGLAFVAQARPFTWHEGAAYERLRMDHLKQPREQGLAQPLYATRALMQMDEFAKAAVNAGHIGIASDPDGVYRHMPMLLKVDALYVPTLTLSMFLDYVRVPFEDVMVHWGREIVIPATPDSWLEQDVIIPIDTHGQTFIPYAQTWAHDFKEMGAHTLLQYRNDADLAGNVTEFFEGKFVLIGDFAIGAADMGQTPLEAEVPLVALHASLLNGLLTNTFYRTWSFWSVLGLIGLAAMVLGLSALSRSSWVLYITGGIVAISVVGLAWQQIISFVLFPVFAVGSSMVVIFFGLVIGLHVASTKDQAFIRDAFAKYVPEKVVNQLLLYPELLQLGGEERVLSVLFSDLERFTTIAERMAPSALVRLLNEYLSAMTEVILAQSGIIDKYEGDGIMAEFGTPLVLPNHADMAVQAGLTMQRRLQELNTAWAKQGLPVLRCRIGIHTGLMVVGNMGSHQVFDYTVTGDAVNLASRLEGANKLYQTCILISQSTYEHLSPETFRTRVLDVIRVTGRSQAVQVFEVYGACNEDVDARDLLYYQTYHEAFEAYLGRNFAVAREQFTLSLSLRPHDLAAQAMLTRLASLNPHELSDDWDGSVALTSQ